MASKEYERQQQDDEAKIFSNNFQGLNTTASPLNIPYEDSPFLLNTITDISGNVNKRPGTRVIWKSDVAAEGVALVPFSTGLNYNFLVAKQGKFIRIYEVFNDTTTLVVEKANVFDDAARTTRAFILPTSEVEPRLIFLTGVNKPVQLKFIEQQFVRTTAGTSAVIPNAERFKNANTTNTVFFVNRVRTTPTSVSYNAGTKQLTAVFSVSQAIGTVVDAVLITWQWWAEGQHWNGENFYSTANRFNVTPIDQNVGIPESLTSDLDPKDVTLGRWDLYAYRKAGRVTGSPYTRNTANNPATEDEYSFGDGNRYIPGSSNYTRPTPYYFTFGTTQTAYTNITPTPAASSPSTVHITRYRQLKFNSNNGILSQYVDVFVDGVKKTQIDVVGGAADLVEGNYFLYLESGTNILAATLATDLAYQIGFNAVKMGLPSASFVAFANNQRTHIGTGALGTIFDYNDGSYIIAYGLGQVADYQSGYYPSVGSIYQNRMVLGGYGHRPLTLVFSSVLDSSVPGEYYSDFQITAANTLDTAPFDMVINSRADDRLVALVEWQSSLFALTRKAVFRLTGSDNSPLSPSARYVNFISATGCVNHSCVTQADFSVVYLSDTGLYDLTPMVENGEYQVRERSIKIRDKFNITDDPTYENLPWIRYDQDNRYVIVGYPAVGQTSTTRYLYVYNTFRDSWTEFNTPGGFNTFHGMNYVDRLKGAGFLVACSTELWQTGTPANFILLRFNDSRFIDFRQTAQHNGVATTNYYVTPPAEVKTTVTARQQHFGVTFTATRQPRAFTQHPVQDVDDISVRQTFVATGQTRELVKGIEWVKEASGYIYLIQPAEAGDTVTARQKLRSDKFGSGEYSCHQVIVNNVNTQDYTYYFDVPTQRFNIRLNNATNLSNVETGNPYLAIYSTPMFTRQMLGNYKKMRHAYLYFDNRGVLQVYTAGDANVAAGQSPAELVDTYKTEATANVTMMFNSDINGETSADIYGFQDLYWDDSVMDIAPAASQNEIFQMFKEPIQGIGYSYQMGVWNYDDGTFKLCGYQIDIAQKGKRYIQR